MTARISLLSLALFVSFANSLWAINPAGHPLKLEAEQEFHAAEETQAQDFANQDSISEAFAKAQTKVDLESAPKGLSLIRDARNYLDFNKEDNSLAERTFLAALKYELTEQQLAEVLLTLGRIYEKSGATSRELMIYEQFLEKLPNDKARPQVLLRQGRLYRSIGENDMAVNRFYGVINMSFKIGQDDLNLYHYLTQQAQLEIADTYFMTQNYEKAISLFQRLKLQELKDDERERVEFKEAYTHFHLANYPQAIETFSQFQQNHPQSQFVPEGQYILASAYRLTGAKQKAVDTVVKLIGYKVTEGDPNRENWFYWKKKTANQMANDSYQEGDFLMALSIYQAMASLSDQPEWQWPVIYQIGRCFESLQKFQKAEEAYTLIVSGEAWKDKPFTSTPALDTVKENAQWRLQHLVWLKTANVKIEGLLNPVLPSQETQKAKKSISS